MKKVSTPIQSKSKSQLQKVKSHLTQKKSITSWEAIEKYKITRLASVIHTLRKDGWIINNKPMTNSEGNNFVKYVLVKSK
jgi:hypothetical protein